MVLGVEEHDEEEWHSDQHSQATDDRITSIIAAAIPRQR